MIRIYEISSRVRRNKCRETKTPKCLSKRAAAERSKAGDIIINVNNLIAVKSAVRGQLRRENR